MEKQKQEDNHSKEASINSNDRLESSIKQKKIYHYLNRNGDSVKRGKLLASRILKGGVKEYDQVLKRLEQIGKIIVNQERPMKQDWVYSVH